MFPLKKIIDYCIIDTETTGLDVDVCSLVEVGVLKIKQGNIVDEFHELIKPRGSIPLDVTAIHGITDTCVVNADKACLVLPKVRKFIGNFVVVGHNIKFDMSFLDKFSDGLFSGVRCLDTRQLAELVLGDKIKNRKQETIERYYGIKNKERHRVMGDVCALREIFSEFVDTGVNVLDYVFSYKAKRV